MNRIMTRVGTAIGLVVHLLMLGVGSTPAWAQEGPQQDTQQADWVLSYALVIVCIGLGVFVVCRPGRRGHPLRRRE